MSTPVPESHPDSNKPANFKGRALAITPVVLTLLGTALAGLSSSEMTRAQYHRALAAQHQSKDSDAWNLFQFKRTRRMLGEQTVELSGGGAAQLEPVDLETAAARIASLFDRAHKEIAKFQKGIKPDVSLNAFGLAADQLGKQAAAEAIHAQNLLKDLRRELARPEVREDLAYLGVNRLPPFEEEPISDPDVVHLQRAVLKGPLRDEDLKTLARLSDEHLTAALAAADANARAAAEPGKRTDRRLRQLDALIERQRQGIHAFHRSATALQQAADDLADAGPSDTALKHTAQHIRATDRALNDALATLNAYRMAREDYNARRNAREAQQHQKVSQLYELRVHKSDQTAERYRKRSGQFFIGMLLAQAGAAIASLALAGRQHSLLWAIAGTAGLAAVAFSTYVYLVF